jgi:hypothetical protein
MQEHGLAALVALLVLAAQPALAAELPEFTLTIRGHRFDPPELRIPAGQKVRVLVVNADSTPEEFESHELNREKVIPGNATGIVFLGPLAQGTYPFFGDFNQATAQGAVVVK